MSRLPPVATLRAFEAAARHLSFTKAAQELFITQSAVSRQIRNLEEWFGVQLFTRGHRQVTLTSEGEMYRRELSEAFNRIDLATRRLNRTRSRDVLYIHVYVTFAMHWLIPRLRNFQDTHPELDVELTASLQAVDFRREDIHCAVRTGPHGWNPGVRIDKIYGSRLFPVASPDYSAQRWPALSPDDLNRAKLLHSLARPDDWRLWLKAAGLTEIDPDRGGKFESSSMAYLAAQQGMGVAIAQDFLVQPMLRDGSLVRLFQIDAESDRVYYLLTSPRYEDSPSVELFRKWMLAEVAKSTAS